MRGAMMLSLETGWNLGEILALPVDEFVEWIETLADVLKERLPRELRRGI